MLDLVLVLTHAAACWGLLCTPGMAVSWGPETCQARSTGLEERHAMYAVLESPALAGVGGLLWRAPTLVWVASHTTRLVFLKQTLA